MRYRIELQPGLFFLRFSPAFILCGGRWFHWRRRWCAQGTFKIRCKLIVLVPQLLQFTWWLPIVQCCIHIELRRLQLLSCHISHACSQSIRDYFELCELAFYGLSYLQMMQLQRLLKLINGHVHVGHRGSHSCLRQWLYVYLQAACDASIKIDNVVPARWESVHIGLPVEI